MKQIIIIFLLALTSMMFLESCSKNEKNMFSKDYSAIVFHLTKIQKDSIDVNFLFYPDNKLFDTLKIPTRIVGVPQNRDRHYLVSIVKEKTTAKEGVHYIKLKNKYLFRSGLYQDTTLAIVIKRDKSLTNHTYKLVIKLEKNEDFILGPNEKLYKHQIIIKMSANLDTPPLFWKRNFLHYQTGPYHAFKCKKFIEIAGVDSPLWRAETFADRGIYIKKVRKWFRDNPTYRNGIRLLFE
jgi:hypothetical protein